MIRSDLKQPESPRFSLSYTINFQELALENELGRGGFGVVYKATYRHNDVAVKQLLSNEISSESAQEFETESQVMAQLRSPNIVQFYGYSLTPTRCIVMEFMANGSLYSVLHSKNPLDWPMRLQIATDTAKGLAFLHHENILHRDIKSLNVLLDKHNQAKLTDFGLSKVKAETKSKTMVSKTTKDSVGTLAWMAPELFSGRKAIFTQKSDIYSLGITFWELASRKIPFADAISPELIPTWVKDGDREDIPTDCPPTFGKLIKRCWKDDPVKRPDGDKVIKRLKKTLETLSPSLQQTTVKPMPNTVISGPQYLNNLTSEGSPKPMVFSQPKPLSPQSKPPVPNNNIQVTQITPQIKKEPPKDPLLKTLKGHTSNVHCLQLLPSGELVSSSSDNTLKVWDLKTGACLKTLTGHTNDVHCLQLLPSGELVSSSLDKTLKVWDSKKGKCLKTLKGHSKPVACLQLLPSGELVSGSYDNTLKVWDLKKGKCLKTLDGHSSVTRLQLLPSGELVSGSNDKTLKVWDLKTGKWLQTLSGHNSWVTCLQLLPSGELVSGSRDGTLKVWDLKTGTCLKTLTGHTKEVSCLQLLPSNELVSGAWDNTLKVWDLTGTCLQTLTGHTNLVHCLQLLPSNELVSSSSDNTLKVWDLKTGTCLKTLSGHTSSVHCLQLLPSGELVSGSSDKTLKVWDMSEFSKDLHQDPEKKSGNRNKMN